MREAAKDLKAIYNAPTGDAAEVSLNQFSEKWDNKYPMASRCWYNKWDNTYNSFF